MPYETFYDTGLRSFNHDKTRGKWSTPKDFLFACIGHGFKVDAAYLLPVFLFEHGGIFAMVPYFIGLVLCVVPIVFMQSFLGQFSSTGFISALRIAPLFKGIGYVSLALNILILTYYSVFAAIPLFYFFNTLRPTIPWSCGESGKWTENSVNVRSICDKNTTDKREFYIIEVPSINFFRDHITLLTLNEHETNVELRFSWPLMICSFLVWIAVAAVLRQRIELIGRLTRYSCLAVIGILILCVVRFSLLPGALSLGGLGKVSLTKSIFSPESWILSPVTACSVLGPSWGTILTMASYNKFKTNIAAYSWLVCFAQAGMMFGLALLSILMMNFMKIGYSELFYMHPNFTQWKEFLTIPTGLTFLELPHFWSLLFFSMIILGCLNLMIVQLLSLLTTLFDEFEVLRGFKKELTLAACGGLAIVSLVFCSNHGIHFSDTVSTFSLMTQMVLNLLLLLVVLWIYGRVRYQSDIHFMTSVTYSTWMVNVTRFVTPVFLLLSWLIALGSSLRSLFYGYTPLTLVLIPAIVLIPWCLAPGYCIFKMIQASGAFRTRWRRCVRPTDWYPADPFDRQRYEETFNNAENLHQLTTEAM